jgi:hypothetical protein
MHDKSEKDSNFVDPEEEFRQQKEREEKEKEEEDQESVYSDNSDEKEPYDPNKALSLYRIAKQQIPLSLAARKTSS